MAEHNIKIHTNIPTLKARRTNDASLMDTFLTHTTDPTTLYRLNICRLHLHCTHLSDLATSKGTKLRPTILGNPREPPTPIPPHCSPYSWPPQPAPPRPWWKLWRHYIQLCFLTHEGTLKQPLGEWSQDEYLLQWDWFLDHNQQHLWAQPNSGRWITYHRKSGRNTRSLQFHLQPDASQVLPPISSLTRTTVIYTHNHIEADSPTPIRQPTQPTTPNTNREAFLSYLHSEPDHNWTAEDIHLSPSIDNLLYDFTQGNTLSVSDGSYSPEHNTGGMEWKIVSQCGTEYIQAGGIIPGTQHSAYRSELGGLYGRSIAHYALWQIKPATQPLVIACDGLGALKRSLAFNPNKQTTSCDHYDMISAIMGYWNKMNRFQYPIHVRGHQDATHHSLTRTEKINVEMDSGAKARVKEYISKEPHPRKATFPTGLPRISINNTFIDSFLHRSLHEQSTTSALRTYWTQKCHLPPEAINQIDWETFGKAFKSTTRHRKQFIIKWISGHGAFGKMMEHRKARHLNHCPRCKTTPETPYHCLTCRGQHAPALFKSKLNSLATWLRTQHTDPAILTAIITNLTQWHHRPSEFHHDDHNNPIGSQPYVQHQTNLGWFPFINGFIAPSWRTAQQTYYNSHHPQRSSALWASRLLTKLWTLSFSLWQHRNKILKQPENLQPMQGIRILRRTALRELRRGLDGLPILFRSYFARSPGKLLNLPTQDLIGWYKTVKLARESTNQDIVDAFSTPGALRSWIGLPTPNQENDTIHEPARTTAPPTHPQ